MAPGYTVSAEASVAVAQICTRLEGLPLALELVAGRLVLLAPAQVMALLDNALGLLAGGDGVSRHRTLRAALDWSYDLLTEEDRSTFRRLSAFAGTFSLSAAATVLEMDETATLDRLAALRDRSLLVADTGRETGTFRLLEPVRQYGDDRLSLAGEEGVVGRLHARWVLASIEVVCASILGHGQLAAVRTFRELLPDFRRGFSWSLREEPAWAARMAAATEMAWEIVGQLAEGDIILRAALEARPTDSELARIYFGLANLGLHHGDPRALEFAQRAVGCARAAAATGIELGHALCVLGFATVGVSGPDFSDAAFDEAAEVADRIGDRLLRVWVDSGRIRGIALAGKLDEARRAWEAQIPVLVELGDIHHVGMRFSNIAYLCQLQGDNVGARRALRANLRLLAENRNWAISTNCVAVAAVLAARAGRAREAARLAGAYWRLCKLFDVKPGTLVPELDVMPGALGPELDLVRSRLTPRDYGAAVADGASLPIAEMYELAEQEAERSDPIEYGQLTGRELQVAKLVARGLSDKEVAARLSRSERTVESHVQHALRKLNMTSRTELGAWAQRHGLLD
jgi:DNA-binding CsgD family transcriptional regulator